MKAAIRATLVLLAAAAAAAALAGPVAAQTEEKERHAAGDLRKAGTVRFAVTCDPAVKADFERAVALLHSFFYEEARLAFEDVAARDPACAMAHWGIAMTHYHPLWTPPTDEEHAAGLAAIARAKAIGGKSPLERGLIFAIESFYLAADGPRGPADGPQAQSCHGPRDHKGRALAYVKEMERLHREYPDDVEVATFHALALLGTAPPEDKTYARQLRATAMLERLFEANPDHPGIAHYLIHGYDYPALAERGLPAARKYAKVAPWVPHALHMPSHIFTRLGMWRDSIASNRASADAARAHMERRSPGATSFDELHALDYLAFAYLQIGDDARAKEVVDSLARIERTVPRRNFAAAFAVGAIPARYALERRQWAEAAALEPIRPEVLEGFPYAKAHIEFARAVGGGRSGKVEVARKAVAALDALRAELVAEKQSYWADQVEIQRLAAAGWLAHAEGERERAVDLLRQAADLEDRAGTHPVTPGAVLPAREQLGDLLLLQDEPARALVEYERSNESFPDRLLGLHGAGRAAELSGDAARARRRFERLLSIVEKGAARPEVEAARAFLAARGPG